MAKRNQRATAAAAPTSALSPVAAAAAARRNEKKRKQKANERNAAVTGFVVLVAVAVALHATGGGGGGTAPPTARRDSTSSSGDSGKRRNDHRPWRTARFLAEKWGDEKGTIQKYRDFDTVLTLHSIDDYMTNITADPFYEQARESCNLKGEWCAEMATRGLCPDRGMGIYEMNDHGLSPDAASTFMEENCLPACKLCHLASRETRCPVDMKSITTSDALKGPGELDAVFETMLAEEAHRQYGPIRVHSKPGGGGNDGVTDVTESVIDGPWVVAFDNLLTPEECARLRDLGASSGPGFRRSKTGVNPTDTNNIRTSSTNWCMDETYPECHSDPIVRRIHHRIEGITGINETNYEYLQILQYKQGEHYHEHHDFNLVELDRAQGVRLLTVFLYLSNVEVGGGTNFPNLGGEGGLTVLPEMGKAVIWPSVLDSNPNVEDPRTRHAALTVEKGVKYGANVWIHQRDHKTPFGKNCQ